MIQEMHTLTDYIVRVKPMYNLLTSVCCYKVEMYREELLVMHSSNNSEFLFVI